MESGGIQQGPCLICNQVDKEIISENSSSSFPPFPGCPPTNSSSYLQPWSTFFIRRVLQLSEKECAKLLELENDFRLQGANSSENLWFRTCSKCSESIISMFQMQKDIISLKLEMAKVQEEIVENLKTSKRKLDRDNRRDDDDIEVIDIVCSVREYFTDAMLKPARKRKKYGFCETCMDTTYLHISNTSEETRMLTDFEKKLNQSLRCSVKVTRTNIISSPSDPSASTRTYNELVLNENTCVNQFKSSGDLDDLSDLYQGHMMATEFEDDLGHNMGDSDLTGNEDISVQQMENDEGLGNDKGNSREGFETDDDDSDYSVTLDDLLASSNPKHGRKKKKRKSSSDATPLPKKPVVKPKPDGDVDVDAQPKPPFNCHICQFTVNVFTTFKKHMRQKHDQTYDFFYQCDKCEFQTDRYKLKEYHVNKHKVDDNFLERPSSSNENEIEFICKICNDLFKRVAEARKHVRAKHGTQLEVNSYECSHCDKTFSSQIGMRQHVICVHEKVYAYPCKEAGCDARFKKWSDLEHHKWSHVPEDQCTFICDHCGLDFAAPRGLKRHLKLFHSAKAKKVKKEVECSHCGIKLIHMRALKIHLRTAHLDQFKFKCPQCDEIFKCSKVLKYHIGTKHTNERYKCGFCQKIFPQVVNLRAHMKGYCRTMPSDFDVGSFDFKATKITVKPE